MVVSGYLSDSTLASFAESVHGFRFQHGRPSALPGFREDFPLAIADAVILKNVYASRIRLRVSG